MEILFDISLSPVPIQSRGIWSPLLIRNITAFQHSPIKITFKRPLHSFRYDELTPCKIKEYSKLWNHTHKIWSNWSPWLPSPVTTVVTLFQFYIQGRVYPRFGIFFGPSSISLWTQRSLNDFITISLWFSTTAPLISSIQPHFWKEWLIQNLSGEPLWEFFYGNNFWMLQIWFGYFHFLFLSMWKDHNCHLCGERVEMGPLLTKRYTTSNMAKATSSTTTALSITQYSIN